MWVNAKNISFGFLLLTIVVFNSCKNTKKIKETQLPVPVCSLNKLQLDSLGCFPDSTAHRWYKIKGDVHVELQNDAYDIDLQLRIKPNEIIWISLSKAGFPVAKILLKTDSVYGLDLFHKKHFKSSYDSLGDKLGVKLDFKVAQSILLGQFIPYEGQKFNWLKDNDVVVSNFNKDSLRHYQDSASTPNSLLWAQWLDCKTADLKKQFVKTDHQEEIWVKFNDVTEATELNIPTHIEVNAFQAGIKKLFCTLEYKKFKTSNSLNVPFEIPADYAEME